MDVKISRIAAYAALVSMSGFAPQTARACAMAMVKMKIGTSFRVEAKDRDAPVVGTTVTLERGDGECSQTPPSASVVTDNAGLARFDSVAPGDYHVCIRSTRWGAELIAQLKVSRWAAKGETIPTTVEGSNPLPVRSANGFLRGPDFYPLLAQAAYDVDLLDAGTNAKVATTKTGTDAGFSFENTIAPGRYWLQVSGALDKFVERKGKILIEVNPDAADARVDIDVTFSDCGMASRQRETKPTLTVAGSACGIVTDPLGASIERATVLLIDDTGRAAATTKTNREGAFKIDGTEAGTYEFVTQSIGFIPFARTITVQPGKDETCATPISVKLVLGYW
jgi:Carboxypeptidase regulatory-like domain